MKEKKSLAIVILTCLAAIPALYLIRKLARKAQFAELIRIAEEGIEEYCTGEGLSRDEFGPALVAADSDFEWAIEFHSNTEPRHIVIYYTNGGEIVERHQLLE